jgi:hypothetical protein
MITKRLLLLRLHEQALTELGITQKEIDHFQEPK